MTLIQLHAPANGGGGGNNASASSAMAVEHRSAPVGGGRAVVTPLPASSYLARLHPVEGEAYDRMIVITELEGGKALFLSGWIGKPLGVEEWRAAAAELFPRAERVGFQRRKADGWWRMVWLSLRS